MDLCTYRCPTIAYRADSCTQGLGGFSHRGRAWRFRIPTHLNFRATLNFLEFIASTIGPWIDILENNTIALDCILSQIDSSTTEGWLRRFNFKEETESNLQTGEKLKWARDHSSRTLDNELKEYSQWFPGKENEVADSLSRDYHIIDQQLTFLLFSIILQQKPPNFKISPLPPVIVSTLLAILQWLSEATQQRKAHQRSRIALGFASKSFSNKSTFKRIPFSTLSPTSIKSPSSLPSPKPCAKQNFLQHVSLPWSQAQFVVSWTMWDRPSGITFVAIPDSTKTGSLQEFYKNSTMVIKIRIQIRNNKK